MNPPSVFLHEVAHNLQADLRVWQENKDAVTRRMMGSLGDPMLAATFSRWHKEIFADLAAVLLGGTAVVWGMMDFLAHPSPKVLTYRPGGVHPTGYLRVPILAEMLRRMGFADDAVRVQKVWASLYRPERGHRLPPRLLETAGRSIPVVVDEIAFQPRRNLAQRALADVILFDRGHERQIRSGAAALARNMVPEDLPPRFMVSASRQAIGLGASLPHLAELVTKHLAETAAARRSEAGIPTMMAA